MALPLTDTQERRLRELRVGIRRLGRVVVACSGGVDSSLLAVVAHQELGEAALAVTAVSAAVPDEEVAAAEALAHEFGVRWRSVPTHEIARPGYVANTGDRCYHCRSELFEVLAPIARAEGAVIAVGTITDDFGDHRPGHRAADEHGVRTPLADAGFSKEDVRWAARDLGLPNWDKPAAPCLASRLPVGTEVTVSLLDRVGRAERALRALGFADLRVRHYGETARLEFPLSDLPLALARRAEVVAAVRGAGYNYVTLDLEGLRSGNVGHEQGRVM